MSIDAERESSRAGTSGVHVATLLRALLPTVAATAIVVFFFARTPASKPKARADGMMRVALVQKDSAFQPIPASRGGATGEVLYSPKGPALHFVLHALALPPGIRYALEIQVDDAIYTVATHSPDTGGRLTIDTTLTQFQEGECVGANYDPPRPVIGHHTIKFWIKRDGSPISGTMPGISPATPGAQLSCHGNGDGDYKFLLLENEVANFTGTGGSIQNDRK
jgi:hypothetical protein